MPRLSPVDWGLVALITLASLTFLALGDWLYAFLNGPLFLISFLFFRFVASRRHPPPEA